MWKENIERHGFAILLDVLSSEKIRELSKHLEGPGVRHNRAGIRHALGIAPVAAIARGQKLMDIAKGILGGEALPIRATLFDKSPLSNWLVVWHQDTALPMRERRERMGSMVSQRRSELRARTSPCSRESTGSPSAS